jgi:hypothetical protein
MNRVFRSKFALFLLAGAAFAPVVRADGETQPGRDRKQPIDEAYTAKMKKYTTAPFFTSPLVDYLPASKTVPTPEAVLGDVSGAPGILPYAEEVYRYMRMLEKASPRVKVFSIGTTEEGREMIAVALSSEANLKKMEENRALLAKLADPRTLKLNDTEADKIVAQAIPIYYITGTIHSPETGAPTALMELAYRLAVDESPYIKDIRDGMITLITPVVEVDGRDRMVDLYKWHLAHPGQNYPNLVYWGKYVAHDNNRDAMGVTLKLTENVMNTYAKWNPQVLHDLHESVPYLYDNTIGDGPYNAWIDPILADEWNLISGRNVADMTKFGMPGVFSHGDFDTWSPGYLMFIAALHNGISRLYETFGNGGADTGGADARSGRVRAHLVQAESAAAQSDVVAARQQQLRRDGAARFAALLQREQAHVPEELLPESQALRGETENGRSRGLRAAGRRSAHDRATRTAQGDAQAACGSVAADVRSDGCAAAQEREETESGREEGGGKEEGGKTGADDKNFSGRQLRHPHGPALLANRRCAARLSVLESGGPAEDSV